MGIDANGFFQVNRHTVSFGNGEDEARRQFRAHRAMICDDAIAPDLVRSIMGICARATFVSDEVEGLGHRLIEHPAICGNAIGLALARPALFRWLEQMTGCAPIAKVDGRVVETHARPGDELTWHDDLSPQRRLAISIRLGDASYQGGGFEMRSKAEGAPLFTFAHERPGTALIFDVADTFEHRVLPVTSGGPRRNYTGWFLG